MRESEQRVDQCREAIDFFEHAAHRFFVLRRTARFSESLFADAANHRERRAELVRCVRGESAQLVERCFQPGKGLVDDRGEPPYFVSLVRYRQPLMQPVGRDPSGLRGETIDRRQRAAREDVTTDAGKYGDDREPEHEHRQDLPQLGPQPIL